MIVYPINFQVYRAIILEFIQISTLKKKKKKRCERRLIVIKIREIVRENKGRDKFEVG